MTGLYKTEVDRNFWNYYALNPFSEDVLASKNRALLIFESLAITVLSLGIYPFLLGVCMLGETILSGRISDNIEGLADVIDRITAAKKNVLNPQIAVSEGTDYVTQLPPELQYETFSQADNRAAISQTSRLLNQAIKNMPGAKLKSDISFLQTFLKINNEELLNEFNAIPN